MRFVRLLLLLTPVLVEAQSPGHVHTAKLDNGMNILVQEDHSIPTVALYLFYKVGSRDERPGITGISHFFEHMMFNGSSKFGPGEFDRLMEENGGNNNAYTTKDVTVYTDWFPPTALNLMMDMESDRMAHLTLNSKTIESERGVVYSERRLRVDNDNFGALSEQVTATAIMAHPYHWPVVGWPSDIEAWTRQDLEAYYQQGYAPNNSLMVVVGDVDPNTVFDLAKKYFASIPSHPTFSEPRTKEPPQEGERIVKLKREAELPLLLLAFHMPPSHDKDNPAIQVAETILSAGDSSRLHSCLVDKEQAALNVQAFDEPSLDSYLLGIYAQPRAGVSAERVKSLVFDELNKLISKPVSGAELRKAKNQWLAAHYRSMTTVSGRANLLGTYQIFYGSFDRLFTEPERIEAVAAADVQRVAQNLFRPENCTTGILEPQKLPLPEAKK
ncbi:MAG TPA: pitrilysin family protein [Bryobacteraceae bacterium]|nr:pitrilysin family protein [Bryobacteraceae bacterium]